MSRYVSVAIGALLLVSLAAGTAESIWSVALLGPYERQACYGCGAQETSAHWCFDLGGRSPHVSVTPDGVRVLGSGYGPATVQKGMSFCINPILAPQRLECAVLFETRSRETQFVLEFYSLDYGCAMAQVSCDKEDFGFTGVVQPCPSPNVYPRSNEKDSSVADSGSNGTYVLRMIYDDTSKTIAGYLGEHIIGRAPLSWSPGAILVRIFAATSRWFAGDVDLLIKEVRLGWDSAP